MHSIYPGSKSRGHSKSLLAENAPIKCDNANLLVDGILSLVHKSDSDESRNDKFNKENDIQFIL